MDNYHILNQIGEGAFGRVYRARKKYTGVIVAIKKISKKNFIDSPEKGTLNAEIKILRELDHPNIMRIIDDFESNDDFYVVSEIGLGDLSSTIRDNQTLPEQTIKIIAAQLASALKHCHDRNIIHRDLKLQNVLIARNQIIKICDFGFARCLSAESLAQSFKGTPLYMSPEQIHEKPYDKKVDIWSLGVILFELFFRKPPFNGNTFFNLAENVTKCPLIIPKKPKISAEFRKLLTKMLDKDPSKRPSSNDLLQDPFLSGVDLSMFSDLNYLTKNKEFDNALDETKENGQFSFTNHPILPPFQVLSKPLAYPSEQLQAAISNIYKDNLSSDSDISKLFVQHFSTIVDKKQELIENILTAANYLMQKDRSLNQYFYKGISFLPVKVPPSIIEFLTYALVIPSSSDIILDVSNTKVVDFAGLFSKCNDKLKDNLRTLTNIEQTITLLSYLTSHSSKVVKDEMLCSDSFLEEIISIFHNSSPVVKSSIICIMTHILTEKKDAHQCNFQKTQFFNSIIEIIHSNITDDIETFCLFSSCLSFLSKHSDLFSGYSIQLNKELFSTERITSLIPLASVKPKTEFEFLSYISIQSSPFWHATLTPEIIDLCLRFFNSMLPIHQHHFLRHFFSSDFDCISGRISSCLIPLIEHEESLQFASRLLTDLYKTHDLHREEISCELVENDILLKIKPYLQKKSLGFKQYIYFTLSLIIVPLKKISQKVEEQALMLLDGIFDDESSIKYSLRIAAHLAWLSQSFVKPIIDNNGIQVAQTILSSNSHTPAVKSASQLIGHIFNYDPIPLSVDTTKSIIPLLMKHIYDLDGYKKCITYALGNCIYKVPATIDLLEKNFSALIGLLKSKDSKIVENGSYILSNIIRGNSDYLDALIEKGALFNLLEIMKNVDLADRVIISLQEFCRHTSGKQYLIRNDAVNIIQRYLERTSYEKGKIIAKNLLQCLNSFFSRNKF